MLLIQTIKIGWQKECRGAPYSTLRSHTPKGLILPKDFFKYYSMGYPSHYTYLSQNKEGFTTVMDKIWLINEYEDIKVFSGIKALKNNDDYAIFYNYEYNMGAPARKDAKHNSLQEQAFSLQQNEYGRIIYNGRLTGMDTGNWYYELNIVNMINVSADKTTLDVFTKEPDKIYKQIAILK